MTLTDNLNEQMTFAKAFDAFVDTINRDMKYYAEKHFDNLKWSDDPTDESAYFVPVGVEQGSRYIRIVQRAGGNKNRSVYCFVDKRDGSILKAAGWKAPAKGSRGNIFKPETYNNFPAGRLSGTGWLYMR